MHCYELAGIGLAIQVCVIYMATRTALRRGTFHGWLFVSAFVLMAARRVTAIWSMGETHPEWLHLVDGAWLPTLISALILSGYVAYRRWDQTHARELREKYRL